MMTMGDEMAHTKRGNNNTYCQDNDLSWLDWRRLEPNGDLFRFVKLAIAFRKVHPVLRGRDHLQNRDLVDSGYPDVSWHGVESWNPDWSDHSRTLGLMLCGRHARGGHTPDDYLFVAMNMHWETHLFELPRLPAGLCWHIFANTSMRAPKDVYPPGEEPLLSDQAQFLVGGRSVVILVGRN
jgi:glycogen operon protein